MGDNRRVQAFFDLYNQFNANPVTDANLNFTTAGPPRTAASLPTYDWPVPLQILQGRFAKVGFQLD
ncbi:MAG: hypothetical protein GEU82_15720 [Luteitalea sp.]|nr:hypothetical protein [Luteitalea sp.]